MSDTTPNPTNRPIYGKRLFRMRDGLRYCLTVVGWEQWRHLRPETLQRSVADPGFLTNGENRSLAVDWYAEEDSGSSNLTSALATLILERARKNISSQQES